MIVKKLVLLSLATLPFQLYCAQGLLVTETELFSPKAKQAKKQDSAVQDYFFWWRQLPTIGLQEHPEYGPVFYPFIPHFFSLQELAPTQGATVKIALIDNGTAHTDLYKNNALYLKAHPYITEAITKSSSYVADSSVTPTHISAQRPVYYADTAWFYANHGTYCAGLIAGHTSDYSYGIAPRTQIASYKIISSLPLVHHDALPLVRALEDAAASTIPIVSLSYSMHHAGPYHTRITTCLKKIPFVCCAAGNRYNQHTPTNYVTTCADQITIGSFGMCKDLSTKQSKATYSTYPISSFTPTNSFSENNFFMVLPGESVLSCCYTACTFEPRNFFVFMQGTSVATPLCSGFLGLLVGALYPTLSYAQIKQLVVRSMVRLHNSNAWRANGLLGTPDMRLALFMGHVLVALKKKCVRFNKKYTNYLNTTRAVLLEPVGIYGKQQSISVAFEDGMIDFLQEARQKNAPVIYTHHHLAYHVQEVAKKVRILCA